MSKAEFLQELTALSRKHNLIIRVSALGDTYLQPPYSYEVGGEYAIIGPRDSDDFEWISPGVKVR